MGSKSSRPLAKGGCGGQNLQERFGPGGKPDRPRFKKAQMIYLDTSCLLKLLLEEPESPDVRAAVAAETTVVVSSLTELETEIQLRAAYASGDIRLGQWRRYQARLTALRNMDPFQFRHLPAAVFQTALRQHRRPQAAHCRSLDRLHLAAIEELNLGRLMTLDHLQGKAARALGLVVVQPGPGQ
jgi:predicted nucleic acid-binding protein